MKMDEKQTRVVTLYTPEETPFFTNLLDLCDGVSREQCRIQKLTRDRTISSARDRVLSARSTTLGDALSSLRNISRASSTRNRDVTYRTRSEVTDLDTHSNAPSDDDNKQLDVMPTSNRQSPDITEYAQSTYRSDLDERMNEPLDYMRHNDPMMRSYTSLNGVAVPPMKSMCVRSKSAINRDNSVCSLSRQCCDVLGPKVCHKCALLKRRVQSANRNEMTLSRLDVSERNFADTIVLQKALPHLSQAEIEDRVISGEIMRLPLRERLNETRHRVASEARRSSASQYSIRSSTNERPALPSSESSTGASDTFFVNIRDLNTKLLLRKINNNWARNESEKARLAAKRLALSANSPSTTGMRYKEFYSPPLLPKVCQNPEPSFFAGRDGGYKLPNRLPDTVVQGQITDMTSFNAAWTGSSNPQSEVEDA